jgi:putative copper export protein
VPLSPLRQGDLATIVVADVAGPLAAGAYTVAWQVAGRDGHPVRGRYRFMIAPGAAGLGAAGVASTAGDGGAAGTPPPATAPAESGETHHEETAMPSGGAFDAESPLFAAVRWLGFAGLLALIGTVGFRVLVVPGSARRGAPRGWVVDAERGARAVGLAAAAVLLVAAVLRLVAQSAAMHGSAAALDVELVGTMIGNTRWGAAWLLQLAASLAAVAGFLVAHRAPMVGWSVVAAAAVAAAVSAALSGHAAAVPGRTSLAVAIDTAHVLGAGGWLGTLGLLVLVGLPAALALGSGERGPVGAAAVGAFSPLALVFAGTVALTGVLSAWMQLNAFGALWTTPYGRTLLVKLGVLLVVAGTGAYNWRRVRPRLGDELGTRRIRRSATVEVLVGVLVLAVTAVLVATPTPMDLTK